MAYTRSTPVVEQRNPRHIHALSSLSWKSMVETPFCFWYKSPRRFNVRRKFLLSKRLTRAQANTGTFVLIFLPRDVRINWSPSWWLSRNEMDFANIWFNIFFVINLFSLFYITFMLIIMHRRKQRGDPGEEIRIFKFY